MTEPQIPPAPTRSGYIPSLDVLRAVAVLSVMVHHWVPGGWLLNQFQDQTGNGVQLFFVLSGFLITRILLRGREQITGAGFGPVIGHFYARRLLRIFPAYYLVLVAGAAVNFVGLRAGFGWHALYLSNVYYYRRGVFDGPASIFWTLSVEEQFYLFWPVLILSLRPRVVLPLVLVATTASFAARSVATLYGDGMFNILTPACVGFLGVGAVVAVVQARGSARLSGAFVVAAVGVIAAGLVANVAAVFVRGFHFEATAAAVRAVNQPVIAVCFAGVIAWLSTRPSGPAGPALRPLMYLGRISYGLYLYHLFVTYGLARLIPRMPVQPGHPSVTAVTVSFAVRFVATVAVASVSWFAVEQPLLRLKRRFPVG